MDFVEGFNAARSDQISVQYLANAQEMSDQVSGDVPFRVFRGLDSIVTALGRFDSDPVETHLNTPVRQIEWRPGEVRAGEFTADAAIVTVPLGVLQSGTIRFLPPIEQKDRAARMLTMGHVVKIIICFRSSFWEERGLTRLSFLHARGQAFPTWWTTRPIESSILVGWAGGPAAVGLAGREKSAIFRAAIESLSVALKMNPLTIDRSVEGWLVADWQSDPFSMGAYSFVPVGAITAPMILAEPIADTLFFAGEATNSDGNCGTMHGAIATGRRAADELLTLAHRRAA